MGERGDNRATLARVPSEAVLSKVMCYEAHLDRQPCRAIGRLERLQRQRRGDAVLQPVQLGLTLTRHCRAKSRGTGRQVTVVI